MSGIAGREPVAITQRPKRSFAPFTSSASSFTNRPTPRNTSTPSARNRSAESAGAGFRAHAANALHDRGEVDLRLRNPHAELVARGGSPRLPWRRAGASSTARSRHSGSRRRGDRAPRAQPSHPGRPPPQRTPAPPARRRRRQADSERPASGSPSRAASRAGAAPRRGDHPARGGLSWTTVLADA